MIRFENVSIARLEPTIPILCDASFHFQSAERIGILAAPGSGKTTLARVLCGIETPSRGRATAKNVSWPLGYAGFFHPNLTVAKNLFLISQICRQESAIFVPLVASLADIGKGLWSEMRNITPTQRAVLAYMCTMASPSRMLVADDLLTVGNTLMRRKCEALLSQRLRTGGLVFLSRNPRQISQYCTRFFALSAGRLVPCDNLEIAQKILSKEEVHV